MKRKSNLVAADMALARDVRRMIEEARDLVSVAVNTGLTMLYWRIGRRINQEILKEGRADYGKQILATLSQELTRGYGNGFSYSALTRMVKFYSIFQDDRIFAALSQQLSWSHFREIFPLEKPWKKAPSVWPSISPIYRPGTFWLGSFIKPLFKRENDFWKTSHSKRRGIVDPTCERHLRPFESAAPPACFIGNPPSHHRDRTTRKECLKEAAVKWCAHASDHAQNHGGTPWQYLLIPHNEIATNMTLDVLAARFGIK